MTRRPRKGMRRRFTTLACSFVLAAAGLFTLAGPAQASSTMSVSSASVPAGGTFTISFTATRDFDSSRSGMGFFAGSSSLGSLDSFTTVVSCNGPVAGPCATLAGLGYIVPTGPVPVGTTVSGSLTLRVNAGTPAGSFAVRYQFDGEATATGPTVTVTASPADQITALHALVDSFGLPAGTQNSLDAKLQDALTAVNNNQTAAACTALTDFINEVNAQDGKKIPTDQAQQLRTSATAIQTNLGC
ncbi:FIMAH domain-containing protein [Streptomyces sp. NBC_00212]|uniref:FIMAH domain-containing protein n=1 Tax=Streptomyces sp. NBC_00212 TaxID=2975684 RepID=UPI002F914B4C